MLGLLGKNDETKSGGESRFQRHSTFHSGHASQASLENHYGSDCLLARVLEGKYCQRHGF